MALRAQSTLKEESSISPGLFTDVFFNSTTKNDISTDYSHHTTFVASGVSGEKYSDDPVSSATAHLVLTVVQVGLLPVLTVGGVIMNVINMVVFTRQGLSDRINLCLFSLAVADTGYISVSMTTRLYSIFSLFDPLLGAFWKVQSLNMVGVYTGFLSSSNCLTLLISLERCVCVLWPLKAKRLLAVRHMAVMIVFIFVTCLCCCGVVSCLAYHTLSYRDPQTNSLVYYIQFTSFYKENQLAVDIIFDSIFTSSLPAICLLGVMMATLLISLRMRTVLSWRMQTAHVGSQQKMTSSERREQLVTRMLMVVCVLFTVCVTPAVTLAFTRFAVPAFEPGRRYNNIFYVTVCVVHVMATLNSSGNFLIYWNMSTKFKATLRGLLQRGHTTCGKVNGAGVQRTSSAPQNSGNLGA